MCLKLGKKARKKSEKVTEKARKKSEKMADKARKQSDKIADKLEEPIEALKGLVVIDKLDAVGEDAAEHLKEVNHQVRGHFFIELSIFSRLLLFWITFHQFHCSNQ